MKPVVTIIIVIAAVLGAFGILWMLLGGTSADVTTTYSQQLNIELASFRKIQNLSLNLSIFQNKVFQTLQQNATSSVSYSRGRTNPFLPF